MLLLRNYLCILAIFITFILTPTIQAQETHKHEEEYHESALRRFEIITLSSLPFTAIHSYLGVRGVRMIQDSKIAPVLSPQNYRVMGICAVSLSLFIGIWDWYHTRDVDRSAPSIPEYKPPTPPSEDDLPPDGTITGIRGSGPNANVHAKSIIYRRSSQPPRFTQLNEWTTETVDSIYIPLFQIRF